MNIIPAIDLRNSKCVRLFKGNFEQQTIYADDPILVAKQFEEQGAEYIHIVDLDGTKNQQMSQNKIIIQIAQETGLKVQAGGGIRDTEQIAKLLGAGIERVIIGSVAVKNHNQVEVWLDMFGSEKIVAAFDIEMVNGFPLISIEGWQKQSEISLWDILQIYQPTTLKHILCTDIDKDGTLTEPNFSLYKDIIQHYPDVMVQASGGISSIADIINLKNLGVNDVIVGKALYENKINLKEALQC